jgi:predicted amidohydrolase YtcJ
MSTPRTTGTATLYTARLVHTLDERTPRATGVLSEHGRILAVGDAAELRPHAREVVAYGDAVITPGLVDGHTHPVHGLDGTIGVELTGARTLADVRRALAAAEADLEPGQWLRGWGLNPVVFGGAIPTAAVLGLGERPAYIQMYDAHSALVSPEALRRAGIDGARAFTSAARIDCDADGRPTGYLLEAEAAELVRVLLPAPTPAEYAARFDELLRGMAAAGLTGMHAMDFDDPSEDLVRAVEEHGDLRLRIGFNPWLMPGHDAASVIALQGRRGRRWRVEGVKLFVDGTVDGGTAWLEYADSHGEGLDPLWRDLGAFRDALTALHRAGVDCAVHAIGDRGVRETLELFAELRATHGPLARHRIEHIETLPEEHIGLFADRAAAASMQPLHCTFFNRADRSDTWSQRLGDHRVDDGFPWAQLRDAGAIVALGTDWPIAPYDPRWTLADAQLRRHFDAEPSPLAGKPLTALQALEGYTTHAAWASGEEEHRGRIAPGYDADLTVWSRDPLTADPEELAVLPVVGTVVDGVAVETG